MSQSEVLPRISITADRGITGALFGLAIIAYVVRVYIRNWTRREFFTEDALLLFAVVCLCCTTALSYDTMQFQYDSLAVILHSNNAGIAALLSVLPEIPKVSKEENAATTFWWLVIFPVKLAYLFFFRRLISRIGDLQIYWWCVLAFTIPAGLVSIAVSWLTCPYFTTAGVLSCSGPSADYRVVRDVAVTTAMDLSTDLLVLSLPIALLWRVQINLRQKIGLGLILCLSLVMAMAAITRIAGVRLSGGAVDIIWLIFWQQQECSIAVIMFSVSAFRPFFVSTQSGNGPPKHPKTSSYWRKRILHRRLASDEDTSEKALPQIPSPTMTGMRTMIEGARMSKWWPNESNVKAIHYPARTMADKSGKHTTGTIASERSYLPESYDPVGVAC